MSTIYDPSHELYRDEADLRTELARVHDVCNSCRRCVDLCPSFPTLFDMLDAHDVPEADLLTPAQQDQVVDACFQCTECLTSCPYAPGSHDADVDVPQLMLRAKAVQFDNGHVGTRPRPRARLLGRSDRIGSIATRIPSLANRLISAAPGSWRRRIASTVTKVSATRPLPTYSSPRFSSWFSARPVVHMRKRQAEVAVFPTCLVEYQAVDIGRDLVKVYERNGIECTLSGARCCGAPLLHSGDVDSFRKVAERNVEVLGAEVRSGHDVVVAQPTCAHVIRTHYPDHVGPTSADDARAVADHTYDAADFLMQRHRSDDYVLDTDFSGGIPRSVAYHVAGHVSAVEEGLASRDLMKLTGARVRVVHRSSGTESIWDLRRDHDGVADMMADRLTDDIVRIDDDVIAGDCHLSNLAIGARTGRRVVHPLQMLARAYGISDDT